MKELYTSPELKVTCFAPVERLAYDIEFELDDLLRVGGNAGQKPVDPSDGDFGFATGL